MSAGHRRRARPGALLGALLALGFTAAARPVQGQRGGGTGDWFVLNSWYQKHGLPENTIRDILETRDGYLWIATHAGVARFDGVNFTVYDDRQKGQLRDIEVQALAEGPDGSLWMGTYGGGLSRLHDGRFTIYTTKEGLIDDFVVALATDREGAVWAGTNNGLARWKDGRFTSFTVADGLLKNFVLGVFPDRDGSLWISYRDGGLQRYHQGKFQAADIPGLTMDMFVREVLRGRDGVLWVASYAGLFRVDSGQVTHYTEKQGLRSLRIYGLVEDGEDMWAAHDRGADRLHDGAFYPASELGSASVTTMARGREGGVWMGVTGRLLLLRRGQFARYAAKEGLPDPYVSTLLEDQHGSVWIGTKNGLARLQGSSVSAVAPAGGLPPGFVGGLALDRNGVLWVGTDKGLYRSQAPLEPAGGPEPRFSRVTNQPEQPPLQARVMHIDRQGVLWIGSVGEGLYRHDPVTGTFTVFTEAQGLLHPAVRGIQEDRDGSLWIGTRKGLNRLRGSKLERFTVAEGLAHPVVEALYLDRDGVLWVGTRQGVSRLHNGRFTTITVTDGLLASYVNGFTEDDEGNLWMLCIRGAFRVNKQELADFAAGKRSMVVPVSYGLEHGLVSTRSTAGFDRAAYKTRDGRIWLGSVQGLSVIDPRSMPAAPPPPPVHIEHVLVDERSQPVDHRREPTVLAPPGGGDLVIHYTALSFLAPEKVRFKYQLAGYDPHWVEAGTRRAAYYSHLPPGRYRFRVIAANGDGVWNTTGATLAVDLRPHWYQTVLFQASSVLVAILLGAVLYRRHVSELRRRQRDLEKRVAERTAELATANRELEAFSYSVSHDLRAPVRSMEGFSRALLERHAASLDAEGQEFLRHIQRASSRMDALIADMLSLARVNRAELRRSPVDLSAMAREISDELQMRQPERKAEVVVAPGLTVQADANLMRIALENLLANAWKFTSKRPRAHIEVGVQPPAGDGNGNGKASGTPAYFVRDDGAGFDPALAGKLFGAFQRLHAPADFEGSGVGLATVRRVIQRHGGQVWAEGTPGEGATFYFTVPE